MIYQIKSETLYLVSIFELADSNLGVPIFIAAFSEEVAFEREMFLKGFQY